jgi:hypothetical protein
MLPIVGIDLPISMVSHVGLSASGLYVRFFRTFLVRSVLVSWAWFDIDPGSSDPDEILSFLTSLPRGACRFEVAGEVASCALMAPKDAGLVPFVIESESGWVVTEQNPQAPERNLKAPMSKWTLALFLMHPDLSNGPLDLRIEEDSILVERNGETRKLFEEIDGVIGACSDGLFVEVETASLQVVLDALKRDREIRLQLPVSVTVSMSLA